MIAGLSASAQWKNANPYGKQINIVNGDTLVRDATNTSGQFIYSPTIKAAKYLSGYGTNLVGNKINVKSEGARLDSAFTYIIGWGDSLTEGSGGIPYPTALQNMTYFTVINKGIGGQTSTQVKNSFIADTADYNKSVIIWAGRNNLLSPATVKADIATMVAALGHTRYLIASILNGADEPSGSSIYNSIISLNNDLKSIYGNNYVDIRSYLVSLYPNPQDIINVALRSDNLHLNTLGYQKTAEFYNSKLGTLFNIDGFLQSKDFKYYLGYFNSLSGTGTANQVAYYTGAKKIGSATNFIYDNTLASAGLGTLPIVTGDGSSWLATGAPFLNNFGGGLVVSIAGINQAYFTASQNYAIVKGATNYLSQPVGVKLQVNNNDEALTIEPTSNIILKRTTVFSTPNSLLISNTSNGSSGIQFSNSNIPTNNKWQFFISEENTPKFKIGQDNIGDYLTIFTGGVVNIANLSGTGNRPVFAGSDGTLKIGDLSGYQTISNLSSDLTASSTKYPSVNAVNTGLNTAAKWNGETLSTSSKTTGDFAVFNGTNWQNKQITATAPLIWNPTTTNMSISGVAFTNGNATTGTMLLGTTNLQDVKVLRNGVEMMQVTNTVTMPFGLQSSVNNGGLTDVVRNSDVQLTNQVITSSTYSLTNGGYITYNAAGASAWSLPAIAGNTSKRYLIMNEVGSGVVTITGPANSISMGGAKVTSITINPGEIAVLYNNSISWFRQL